MNASGHARCGDDRVGVHRAREGRTVRGFGQHDLPAIEPRVYDSFTVDLVRGRHEVGRQAGGFSENESVPLHRLRVVTDRAAQEALG